MNNLAIRKPRYDIPIVDVVMNFEHNQNLWCRVPKDSLYTEFNIATDNVHHMLFFGYREQCERQWFMFPDTKIIKLIVPKV